MGKYNLDDNQIIANLGAAPVPDPEWVTATRQKLHQMAATDVTETTSARTNWWHNLILNPTAVTRKRTFILAGSLLSLLIVGGVIGFISSRTVTIRTVALTPEQQQQILAQVLSKNSNTAIPSPQNNTGGGMEAADSKLASSRSASPMIAPALPLRDVDYNYRYSNTIYNVGPAAARCQFFGTGLVNNQYATYEYFDNQGNSNYKFINLDAAGELMSYNLSFNTPTRNEYYEYRGGAFAVKTVYEIPSALTRMDAEPLPAEDVVRPDASVSEEVNSDQIKMYFGEDAKILSTATEGGKEYYVIEYSFPVDCNQSISVLSRSAEIMDTPKTTNTIVYHNWVDTQTFAMYKTFTYLDSVADGNLIDSSVITEITRQTDFDSVAANFNFDYNVPVRTLDTSAFNLTTEQQAQQMVDYLATLDIAVIVPTNSSPAISSIYASDPNPKIPEGWDYYLQRDFYPAGARGDQMFEQMTKLSVPAGEIDYIAAFISISGYDGTSNKYLNLSGFANSYTDEELLKNRYQEYTLASQQSLTWTIDGQPTTATLYTVSVINSCVYPDPLAAESAASEPATLIAPDVRPCDGSTTMEQKVAIVSYANTKYMVDFTDVEVNGLTFEGYNSKNAADMAALKTQITNLLNQQTVSIGEVKAL